MQSDIVYGHRQADSATGTARLPAVLSRITPQELGMLGLGPRPPE
jgi:hypothetical protein